MKSMLITASEKNTGAENAVCASGFKGHMDALKLLAEIGWALVIISPFVWRYIFNKWDDF